MEHSQEKLEEGSASNHPSCTEASSTTGTVLSPGAVMSPPALTSTPSVPPSLASEENGRERLGEDCSGNPSGSSHSLEVTSSNSPTFHLPRLPVIVLDKLFRFFEPEDLLVVHKVNREWRSMLENRKKDNDRRLQLMQKIEENKENILDRSKGEQVRNQVNRQRSMDVKPGSQILVEVTKQINNTSNVSSTKDASSTGNSTLTTPTSRFLFQDFEEMEKSLKKGQTLLRCRKCKGPVPSPVTPITASNEDDVTAKKIAATRCRLTSRMGVLSPEINQLSARKKSKTAYPMLPPELPVTPAKNQTTSSTLALGERMSQSLVISCGEKSPVSHCVDINQNISSTTEEDSVKGNDLSSDGAVDISSINYNINSLSTSLNLLSTSFNTPSPYGKLKWQDSPAVRTVKECATAEVGQLSSAIPIDASVYPNLILSPEVDKKLQFTINSVKQDLKKPITLNNCSTNGSWSQSRFKFNMSELDESIYISNKKSLSDISSMHDKSLIVCGDKESMNSTSAKGVNLSLNPSLPSQGPKNSKSTSNTGTSDYFSMGSIEMQDGTGISSVSCVSKLDVQSLNESINSKSRSRSLGNMDSAIGSYFLSYDSSSSCPNLNNSIVLECPNPNCSFRFCSSCGDSEHPWRNCHVIDSEHLEKLFESEERNQSNNKNLSKKVIGNGKNGKGPGIKSTKNKALRRLARL